MLFLPQGYKSGKMLPGSGSTSVWSVSFRPQTASNTSGESPQTQRGSWELGSSGTFHPGFAAFPAGKVTTNKAAAGLALLVLTHRYHGLHQLGSTLKGCCTLLGVRVFYQLIFPLHCKMMLLLKLLKLCTSQVLARVGDIDLLGILCWCDHGLSCVCKLLCS